MFGGDAGGIEEDESDDCPVEDLRLDHYSNSNPEKVISSESSGCFIFHVGDL